MLLPELYWEARWPPSRRCQRASRNRSWSMAPEHLLRMISWRVTYRVSVSADGYLPGGYGQVWPGGLTRTVQVGPHASPHLIVQLWKLAVLKGRVVTPMGSPIAGVTVSLFSRTHLISRDSPAVQISTTDETGHFAFTKLPPGRYSIGSIHSYLTTIACRSADAVGLALFNSPECTLAPIGAALPAVRHTSGDLQSYQTTFYPNATALSTAQVLTLRAGEERSGIELSLGERPAVQVSGVVIGPDGPLSRVHVSMNRLSNIGGDSERLLRQVESSTDSNGRFTIPGVPAADYELQATHYPRNGEDRAPRWTTDAVGRKILGGVVAGVKPISDSDPVLEARLPVSVNTVDISDLTVVLQRASVVRATSQFLDPSPSAVLPRVAGATVVLQPVDKDGLTVTSRPNPQGVTEFPSVASGAYRVAAPEFHGWRLESAQGPSGPIDDGILDIRCCSLYDYTLTYTQVPTTISGVVRDKSGLPKAGVFVFVFPTPTLSVLSRPSIPSVKYQVLGTDLAGSFITSHLPAGAYSVVAVSRASFDFDWRERDILALLDASSNRVRLRRGEQHRLELRPIEVN